MSTTISAPQAAACLAACEKAGAEEVAIWRGSVWQVWNAAILMPGCDEDAGGWEHDDPYSALAEACDEAGLTAASDVPAEFEAFAEMFANPAISEAVLSRDGTCKLRFRGQKRPTKLKHEGSLSAAAQAVLAQAGLAD